MPATETDSESEIEQHEARFQSRNDQLRHVIDVLAQYERSELDEHGKKAEIAEEHDVERHRIYYVLNHHEDLVDWRRSANRDPIDPEVVQEAYDDETLRAMAGAQPVADGAGDVTVQIELSLDEVFRAVKLLPGDLGLKVYAQTLESELPRADIRRILER